MRIKKMFGALALCGVMLFPTLSFAAGNGEIDSAESVENGTARGIVYEGPSAVDLIKGKDLRYSSSTFTYNFLSSAKYNVRKFDDSMKNLKISTTTTTNGGVPTFQIDLYRVNAIGYALLIGTRTNSTKGSDVAVWSGVGKGSYKFSMRKKSNSTYLTGSGRMYKTNN